MRSIPACLALAALWTGPLATADGPKDNVATAVRPIPPVGIEIPADDRRGLEAGLAALDADVAKLAESKDAKVADLLPDVRIYAEAVRKALAFRGFYDVRDFAKGLRLLEEGRARAGALAEGRAPWTAQHGLVVRGYVSKIDGSVQPYGLVVPPSYTDRTAGRYRLDLWFHGRNEPLSEVNFLEERRTQPGTFTPPDTIVLHPYGRYCNASKFAGEVDAFEAIESVSRRYRVDEDRVSVRGFSMGGASAWHMAVHHADRWFAANPGAGFSETPQFLQSFQGETLKPTWYEEKLWNLYDCDKVAANLRQVPTVAYSGELDIQKQAADVMTIELRREEVDLVHVIGPGTKHAYHPESHREVERRLALLAVNGRNRTQDELHFVTYTLRYNRMFWLTVDGLGEHWAEARVDATLHPPTPRGPQAPVGGEPIPIQVTTRNVTALTIDLPPGTAGWLRAEPGAGGRVAVAIDDAVVYGPLPRSDGSWRASFARADGAWAFVVAPPSGAVKRHGLQGPIDDAFLDSFIIVRPTGKARSETFARWQEAEMGRAIDQWRRHFRGEPRVKDDTAITDADIAGSSLILWGDPSSNAVLGRVADRLPIGWRDDKVVVGTLSFPAADHAPIAVYPNPLNPGRYVVLNSGFTFREYDYLNNARQDPKLPDWAVIDLKTPPDSRHPGKVAAADFFGENWEVRPPRAE